jgi:hypothetical protein
MDEKLSNPSLSMNKNSLFHTLFGWCMQKKKKDEKLHLANDKWRMNKKLQLSYECLGYGWIILYKGTRCNKVIFLIKKLIVGKTLWMGCLVIYLYHKTYKGDLDLIIGIQYWIIVELPSR